MVPALSFNGHTLKFHSKTQNLVPFFVQHDKHYHLKVLRDITHKYFYQLKPHYAALDSGLW